MRLQLAHRSAVVPPWLRYRADTCLLVTARKATSPAELTAAASSLDRVSPPAIPALVNATGLRLPFDQAYTPVPMSLRVAENTMFPPPTPSREESVVVRVGLVLAPPRTISSSVVVAR